MLGKRFCHKSGGSQDPDERCDDVEEGGDELEDSCDVRDGLLVFLTLHKNSFHQIYFYISVR